MDYRDPDWVAAKLGLDKNTVYKYLHDGTLPAVQLGRKWLISEARLMTWLEQQTDAQTRARRQVARMTERTVRRMETFSVPARNAIRTAIAEARRLGHSHLGDGHLLLGLLADGDWGKAINVDAVTREMEKRLEPGDESRTAPPRRLRRTAVARRAMRLAARLADGPITPQHLLRGLLNAGDGAARSAVLAVHPELDKEPS